MQWMELIRETSARTGIAVGETEKTLNVFLDLVQEKMSAGEMIFLRPDFGYFKMANTSGRQRGRTGQIPVFRNSGLLRSRLRRHSKE